MSPVPLSETPILTNVVDASGIDMLCGGFPCQDLSVAGKRKGLQHDDGTPTRSGLFYRILELADAIGQRWTLLENVPGLLSSRNGEDFAAVVGEMAGVQLGVPASGWRNAGVVLGPKGLVEWVVLDAQYFGVAQRRRRVFIVRDSGDWSNRPPLFLEPESLRGNIAPSRKAGQRVAGSLAARTKGGGGLGTDFDLDGGLIAPSIVSNGDAHSGFRAEGHDTSEDGTGRGVPLTALSLCTSTQRLDPTQETMIPVAFAQNQRGELRESDVSPQLTLGGGKPGEGYPAVRQAMAVRRLTPRECERLQGFPDDYTLVPHRGKPAADGPRYKALGNSWAVPCARWIGERMMQCTTPS